MIKNLPYQRNILTGSTFLNLTDSLAGRPVLMGYEGWLWTHDIDYHNRADDVLKMFLGIQFPELAKKYNIGYVLVAPSQQINVDYFSKNYSLVFQSEKYQIYKVSN